MRRWLVAAWQFLRELSGEAALERRMRVAGCGDPACRVKQAMADEAGDRPRCC